MQRIRTTYKGSVQPHQHRVTRREFEQRFRFRPHADAIGVCFCSASGDVIDEFIFTDELMPFGKFAHVNELERIFKL